MCRGLLLTSLVLMMAWCDHLSAGVIHVMTLDESRVGTSSNANGSINLNFAVGDGFTVARDSLLDPARFGPAGIVSDSVVIGPAISEITTASLTGVDVLVLPVTVLSFSEQIAVDEFLQQGGGLLAFGNGSGSAYSGLLGTSAGSAYTVGSGTVSSTSPIASGPFGTIANLGVGMGFAFSIDSLGANGASVLLGSGSQVLGASFAVGNGRAVIFGDEEIFLSKSVSGLGVGHLSNANNNHLLFLNAFEYVTPAAGFQFNPVPEPSTLAIYGIMAVCCVGARSRRCVGPKNATQHERIARMML